MILNNLEITELCDPKLTKKPMIAPFSKEKIKERFGVKIPSYGINGFGYDIRLSNVWKRPTGILFDMHYLDDMEYDTWSADDVTIAPGHMILGKSMETFDMPTNIIANCLNKSTYARCGIFANITPLENGWRGVLTIEISNTGHIPVKIYAYDGIAQLQFEIGNAPTEIYRSKYQDQTGITVARN